MHKEKCAMQKVQTFFICSKQQQSTWADKYETDFICCDLKFKYHQQNVKYVNLLRFPTFKLSPYPSAVFKQRQTNRNNLKR